MHGLPWYLALIALTSIPGFIHASEVSSRTRAVTYTSRRALVEVPRRKALAGRFATEADAWAAPVQVAIKTSHFFGPYAHVVDNCNFEGKPIKCEFTDRPHQPAPEADALWFHVPSACGGTINRDAPHQLTVAMSMEASTYYSCLNDMTYMDQFDIEMTYRRCSHVQSGYFADGQTLITGTFFKDPLPWPTLHSTIVYINSNCGALNGRNDIVHSLMGLNQIPVDAWGQCLRNKVAPNHHFNKVAIFRQYKFCIAMENSNTMDYVSEKIWQALDAGCLPIYYGAPNIEDYVPHPNSIIDYRKYGTPEKLMEYLVMLNGNETAYMQHHAWRQAPPEQLSPGFRKLVMMHLVGAQHSQCTLCGVVMDHRLRGTNLKQTHCLRNQTWMDAVKNGGSSWGPGSDDALSQPWPLKSRSVVVPSS